MSKATVKTNEVATHQQSTDVAKPNLSSLLDEYAGAGTSSKAEHTTIPMVYILQTNSPQTGKRNPLYVQDAEAGDLWLKNAATPIVKGTQGAVFQPCHFVWVWVEWRPERAGFVDIHPSRPADARQLPADPNDPNSRMQWVRPKTNNTVVETCYVYGIIDKEHPYVIPLSSSGYRIAKDWNTDIRNRKHNGKPLPVFGTKYMLTTVLKSNAKGEWFTLKFDFIPELPSEEEVIRGLELFKAISSGEKKAEQEEAVETKSSEMPF